MSKKANPTLIGGFVLAAIAVGVALIVYLGSGRYGGEWYRFAVYFHGSAAGLQIGAPVVLKGVNIGQVKQIQVGFFPEDEDFIVPVVIEVDGTKILWTDHFGGMEGDRLLDRLIEQGLRARLGLQSVVTGQLRVELGFFPETEVNFRGGDSELSEIPTIPSTLDTFLRALEEVPIQNFATSTLRVIQGLDKLTNAPQLLAILNNLESLTETLDDRVEPAAVSLQRLLEDLEDLLKQSKTTVMRQSNNLDNLTTDARSFLTKLDGELTPALADVRAAADSAERAFDRVDETFITVDEIIGTDSPLRHEFLTLLKNLSEAARSLRIMADYLERHPDALIRGKR